MYARNLWSHRDFDHADCSVPIPAAGRLRPGHKRTGVSARHSGKTDRSAAPIDMERLRRCASGTSRYVAHDDRFTASHIFNPERQCASIRHLQNIHPSRGCAEVNAERFVKLRAAIVRKRDINLRFILSCSEPDDGHLVVHRINSWAIYGAAGNFPSVVVNSEGLRPVPSGRSNNRNVADFIGGSITIDRHDIARSGPRCGRLTTSTSARVQQAFWLHRSVRVDLSCAQLHRILEVFAFCLTVILPAIQPQRRQPAKLIGNQRNKTVLAL